MSEKMNTAVNTSGTIAAATRRTEVAGKRPDSMRGYIEMYKNEFARALPAVITPERFTRIALTALTQNPKLGACSPQSFVGALLTAAQLGLEPNTPLGQAYLIPYGNQCQFQIGYKGMLDLANRSGEIKSVEAHIVYENDEFDFAYGLTPKLTHKPAKTNKGCPVWVYAVVHLAGDGYAFEVMSFEDCIAHGMRYSKTFKNGPWSTEPEQMAKKTVLKQVLKYAPLKSEFTRSMVTDETVQNVAFDERGEVEVVSSAEIVVDVSDETAE